ncbi:hypothetical protein QQS21_011427 [Conoideocrella luteorostrata]|uniref:Xylanolytic transcriptional activator regulatory domain-containing protein n=1 Tax=Conoideocrella luteorostrata TaxID=1105319 RepID=A0AAJ0CDF5_9HYPO|nr:hypothetical protein QQS21_011427 [Conoideocrella luteorostrata]
MPLVSFTLSLRSAAITSSTFNIYCTLVTVREAQALDLHQDQMVGAISEFDFEMRRRLWCVLDTWDWQISALLSRPKLIDRSDCKVALPTLTLDGYSPSPLLHMKLKSEVIGKLAARCGSPREVTSPLQIDIYTELIRSSIQTFPKVYHLDNPDRSIDAKQSWVTPHRCYLHTRTYSMLLDPLRPYMARRISVNSPPDELRARQEGVRYALRLISILASFFEFLYPKNARFHWALFCIFDTAAVLCSAIHHDEDIILHSRSEMLRSIESARSMLARLAMETRTAKTPYKILSKLVKRIENPHIPPAMTTAADKRSEMADESLTPALHHADGRDCSRLERRRQHRGYRHPLGLAPPAPEHCDVTYTILDTVLMASPPPNPCLPPKPRESYAYPALEVFSEEQQLGNLAALWKLFEGSNANGFSLYSTYEANRKILQAETSQTHTQSVAYHVAAPRPTNTISNMLLSEDPATLINHTINNFNIQPDKLAVSRVNESLSTLRQARELRMHNVEASLKKLGRQLNTLSSQARQAHRLALLVGPRLADRHARHAQVPHRQGRERRGDGYESLDLNFVPTQDIY